MSYIKYFIFSLTFCVLGHVLNAQNRLVTDIVVLQNGTELEGYISKQSSDKGISFVAYKTTIQLPKDVVLENWTHKIAKKDLNPIWKEWFELNDPTFKTQKTITLYDLEIASKIDTAKYGIYSPLLNQIRNPRNVHVINRSSTDWVFMDLKEKVYHFKWNEIKEIKGVENNPNLISGLITAIRLKKSNQVFRGTIAGQIPGSVLTIQLNDGTYKDIKIKDIATIEKEARCPDYDLFSQSPVIETVVTNRGRDFVGIITSQNYEKDDCPFLTVLDQNGNLSVVPQSERKEILRAPNALYKEILDVELNDDSLLLNYANIVKFDTIEEKASLIFYAPKNVSFTELKRIDNNEYELVLQANAKVNLDSITIIKLSEIDKMNKYINSVWEVVKKELKTDKTQDVDSLQWFVCDLNNSAPTSFEALNQTPLGNKGFKCKIHSSGKYLIYLRGKKRGILLDIL